MSSNNTGDGAPNSRFDTPIDLTGSTSPSARLPRKEQSPKKPGRFDSPAPVQPGQSPFGYQTSGQTPYTASSQVNPYFAQSIPASGAFVPPFNTPSYAPGVPGQGPHYGKPAGNPFGSSGGAGVITSKNKNGVRAAFVVVSLLLVSAGALFLSKGLWSNTPNQIAGRAKPATELIYTEYTATLTSPTVSYDSDKLQAVLDNARSQGLITSASTDDDEMRLLVAAFAQNPTSYLDNSDAQTSTLEVDGSGSGFNLTSDGYIVTNAHVVVADDKVNQAMSEKKDDAEKKWILNEGQAFCQLLPKANMTDDDLTTLMTSLKSVYDNNSQLGTVSAQVYVVQGSTDHNASAPLDKVPCTVEAVGNPFPDKDVAILKMYTDKVLPTLPLAPDTSNDGGLQVGDKLYVFGFPAMVTFDPNNAPQSYTDPSMTPGSVGRIVPTNAGWDTIQTDAPAYEGNSGGPVLNASGQVVGILTLGSVDPNTGQNVGGFNSIMPVDIIREYAKKAGVTIN